MLDEGLQMSQYAIFVAQMVPGALRGQDGQDAEARQAATGMLSVQFTAAQSQQYNSLLHAMAAQNADASWRQHLQEALAFPNLTRQDENGTFDFDPDPQRNGLWASHVSSL